MPVYSEDKNISNMLIVVQGDITDAASLESRHIDTVVNAAKPTLMGSNQGVDGAIHEAVARLTWPDGSSTFAREICRELGEDQGIHAIRCERGKAVLTSGYGLCKYVLHVVGVPFDGKREAGGWGCSSSSVRLIESCYEEIVHQIKEHTEIKAMAIPVIGAGEYGFPFKLAVRIALATVGNALVEWKRRDCERFNAAGIQQIFFYVYDKDSSRGKAFYEYAECVRKRYLGLFEKDKKVVFQFSLRAHLQYLLEIYRNDGKRGYFSVAWAFRLLLMVVRIPFLIPMFIKDLAGGECWERRRTCVEYIALAKMLLPLAFCYVEYKNPGTYWLMAVVIYCMCDTVTYLLTLILLADIQKPSANVIRSMVMLFVNYMEVAFELAFLYYVIYRDRVSLREAIAFGVLGKNAQIAVKSVCDYAFLYADAGTKFFFTSLVFGYLINHMRQRKFRS